MLITHRTIERSLGGRRAPSRSPSPSPLKIFHESLMKIGCAVHWPAISANCLDGCERFMLQSHHPPASLKLTTPFASRCGMSSIRRPAVVPPTGHEAAIGDPFPIIRFSRMILHHRGRNRPKDASCSLCHPYAKAPSRSGGTHGNE
jgi:hypothetical protein